MSKTSSPELPDNFLLINKPVGWTSFDAVNFIRKKMIADGSPKHIRVGHAGTLDPFATGLLIIGVGREATKRLDESKNLPKTYMATVTLGFVSDTGDSTGTIIPFQKNSWITNIKYWILKKTRPLNCHPELVSGSPDSSGMLKRACPVPRYGVQHNKNLTRDDIEKVINKFIGKSKQIPPMYSAKKIAGKKLYGLARKGKTVKRQPSEIEIYEINLLDYNWPNLKIEVKCSTGTYIRVLAEDIGAELGCGAYCAELIRMAIGFYKLGDAKDLKNIKL